MAEPSRRRGDNLPKIHSNFILLRLTPCDACAVGTTEHRRKV
jgi:hypothetical protein